MLTQTKLKPGYVLVDAQTEQSSINRLLAAAVVSKTFCNLLLGDPATAISKGFKGESFSVSPVTLEVICSIRANSIAEFTRKLFAKL